MVMNMSCVSINLKKDNTIIKIDDNATEEEILKDLSEKIEELARLYQEEKTPIRVTGKILKQEELEKVTQTIEQYLKVPITFDTTTTLGLHSIVRSYKENVEKSETIFHKGSLRSGQKLEVEGSLVVIGDVNAGAEVIARDNIVVLGALRGLAHAGAKGNKEAIIATGKLEAVQIRISNIVREIDREVEEPVEQAYIYVDKDEIVIGNRD